MSTKETNQSAESIIPSYLNGELTYAEKEELLNWMRSDPENARLFNDFLDIWITARAGERHPEYNFHEGFYQFRQKIKVESDLSDNAGRKKLIREILKYAAIIIITALISGISAYFSTLDNAGSHNQSINELIVPLGSNATFSLSDGTTVILNAGSKLKYDNKFGIKERVVSLEGEGFFNVASLSDMPFTVKTSHLNVMALGTSFNIKAYSNDKVIETTLVEGSLKVEGIVARGTPEVTVLKPNQKLTFFKEDSTLVGETPESKKENMINGRPGPVQKPVLIPKTITENVDVELVISWKENKWIFESESLEQIAIELERKFNVSILFESERLKTYRFTGVLLDEPIDQVLEMMSIISPLNFKLRGNVVTLSENKNFEKRPI